MQQKRMTFSVVLFVGLLWLMGCGPTPTPAAVVPQPTTAAPPAAVVPQPTTAAPPAAVVPQPTPVPQQTQPKRGGSLVARMPGIVGDVPDLDPYLNTSFRTRTFAGFFYSRLLKFENGPGIGENSFIPTGDLAEKWEISKDGLTYTFYLRKNAKWQNKPPVNGRPVTADDVVYSWNRFIQVYPGKANWAIVKEVKKVDDTTVTITLNQPFAPFETALAQPTFFIMAKEVIEKDGDGRKTIVGSGPFIFEKYEKGVSFVGKRNPDYYITGMPYIDEIVMMIIPDESAAVAGLRSKQVDILFISAADRKTLGQTNKELVFLDIPFNLNGYFYWKVNEKPFNDIRVRQAFSLALDRDEIIKVIFEGQGSANSILPKAMSSWALDPLSAAMGPNSKYYKRDVAAAKKLLAEAGYPDGLKLPLITTLNAYGDTFNASVELVIKQFKEAGIQLELKPQDYAAFVSTTVQGKFDPGVIVYGLYCTCADPDEVVYNQYHPKSFGNQTGVNDPVLTEMIEKQRTLVDKAERKKLIDDIQRYLAEKQYVVVGSIGYQSFGIQPRVKDFWFHYDFGFGAEAFIKVWLDTSVK
jgi:peptide/nickel transport system substrate-binding protein